MLEMRLAGIVFMVVAGIQLASSMQIKGLYNEKGNYSLDSPLLNEPPKPQSGIVMLKNAALNFLKDPSKFLYSSVSRVRSECCNKQCDFEERCEIHEDYGWSGLDNGLCEASIREGRSCRCKARAGYIYECSANNVGTSKCPYYCTRNHFMCGWYRATGLRFCIPDDKKCNSDNDCTNWRDEMGCTINSRYTPAEIVAGTTIKGGSKYWGNVYVINRPVCDDGWNENAAKVICRSLHFDHTTKGIAWQESKFGKVSTSFRMNDVVCTGSESNIGECKHHTYYNCGSDEGAGVTCVDPTSLAIKEGKYPSEGNVYIMDRPVCDDSWDMADAQVVCNQVFKKQFVKRYTGGVPVFAVTRSSKFHSIAGSGISINNVACKGTESNLAECTFSANVQCSSSKFAGVQCARCTPDNLLDILGSLKIGNKVEDTYKSILEAIAKLKGNCLNWDCSSAYVKYPEYCQVSAFLEDAKIYMSDGQETKNVVHLQTKYNYGQLLNHNFMKENFAKLHESIFQIGDKIDDLQRKLGGYFTNLATFGKEKAELDFRKMSGRWHESQQDLYQRQREVGGLLTDVFAYSFSIVALDLVALAAKLALKIMDALNPAKWGGSLGIEIADIIKEMVKKGGTIARIAYALDKGVKKIKSVASEIKEGTIKNVEIFRKAVKVFDSAEEEGFTLQNARDFLKIYNEFTPSVDHASLGEYQAALSNIIEINCEVIRDADSVAGAFVSIVAAAKGACPKIEADLEVIMRLYEFSYVAQSKIMDSLAQIARAKISLSGAVSLTQVLGDDLKETIYRRVVQWQSLILLQHHKASLIQQACDYITYWNHGKDEKICNDLKQNLNLDTGKLISFEYDKDMCTCRTCSTIENVYPIPAVIYEGKNRLPDGKIDLSCLYNTTTKTDGWVSFKIPDNQWLVDNGWIEPQMINDRFFLQKLQLYLPPDVNNSYVYEVKTKSVLMSNTLNGKEFSMGAGETITSIYEENHSSACRTSHTNLYNTAHCKNRLNPVCVITPGTLNGPIYPHVAGSTWRISLQSPIPLVQPNPTDTFYIKAEAKLCWKATTANTATKKLKEASNPTINYCCYDKDMFYNQTIGMKACGKDPCQPCPENSSLRLFGYYCEKCNAGYEPKQSIYGCVPCKKGMFKKYPGSDSCERCPEGATTLQAGAVKCVKLTKQ